MIVVVAVLLFFLYLWHILGLSFLLRPETSSFCCCLFSFILSWFGLVRLPSCLRALLVVVITAWRCFDFLFVSIFLTIFLTTSHSHAARSIDRCSSRSYCCCCWSLLHFILFAFDLNGMLTCCAAQRRRARRLCPFMHCGRGQDVARQVGASTNRPNNVRSSAGQPAFTLSSHFQEYSDHYAGSAKPALNIAGVVALSYAFKCTCVCAFVFSLEL